jgi:hypothetical protein
MSSPHCVDNAEHIDLTKLAEIAHLFAGILARERLWCVQLRLGNNRVELVIKASSELT